MVDLPKIRIKQGTDDSYTFTFRQKKSAKDITGFEISFVVRKEKTLSDETNENAVINAKATITDGPGGKATLNLTNIMTKEVPVGQYLYEISYKTALDQVYSHYGYGIFEVSYLSNKE